MFEGVVKQTWRGIPREEVNWHPTVDQELCIGCGICVLNAGETFTSSTMRKMWL